MRVPPEAAFLVFLCLWIPVARSQNSVNVPEDEESSGDSEAFSGSGSGDDDLKEFEMATQTSANTTKTAWVTDASVMLPQQTTTQLPPKAQTSHPITKAPALHTTVPETPPSPTSGKAVVTVKEVFAAETTAEHHEETGSPPAVRLPQTPVTTEQWTTTSPIEDTEEETTKSIMPVEKMEKTTVASEDVEELSHAPEVEATASPLTTTGAGESADSETSGDAFETTTAPSTIEINFTEENVVPVKVDVENAKNDADFGFDNEGPKTKSHQPLPESAMGDSSKHESLLEKKEVLAGVVAGGVVGLAFAVMLVALMVYRMKKKDEGSYALDEHKHPSGGYSRPQRQEEFLA